ncbi:6-phosphogluconate dehydrogenase, decarboxylating [Psychromonas marina]|uniref:6-phosphogluconate dehydrogenase, decarboxylating n=1 Tax=Psychromonas marina TaxID=88364 RepID=A0ABQ6E022_9GAMM|nr:decarboxylating NADP(+)-dependent phosphogluconate dehydrogenase [Psychromonas marina]GLS90711.1 6-phosphogluconate dehydrogenase, decarboxylating [Psychromonas marina]
MKADIAVIGLAVMGQNLILNMNDHGFKVVAFNRTVEKVDHFLTSAAKNTNIVGAHSLSEMVNLLEQPRKIMLMVRAGDVVDDFIDALIPLLDKGDIVIDGGNSNYLDSNRRVEKLKKHQLHFVGTGVSGGEEGARNGPSIMPGGDSQAWPHIKPIFQAISAKTEQGEPCCDWVGNAGSGHFVKMIHNGIEYGDMQLISEAYHFMKEALLMSHEEMQATFEEWNKSELNSYLVEITAQILAYKDQDGQPLVEKIMDTAGQKGTGKWTGINALDVGIPLTLITESVFARYLSSLKQQRVDAQALFNKSITPIKGNKQQWIDALHDALLASKIISYAQGFMLMKQASQDNSWELNYGNVALMWRGGCIIRSAFLGNIRDAFVTSPDLAFLALDPYFKDILVRCMPAWRNVAATSFQIALPMPCMTSALTFLDGYTTAKSPANMIQAQRDYFGAHTYERLDKKAGEFFHTDWTGHGGDASSTTYDA